MKSVRPPLIAGVIGTLVVGALAGLGMVPLYRSIAATHADIEAARLSLATLQEQQKNITSVTKSFSSIQAQSDFTTAQFLSEEGSVDFFNAVDELYARAAAGDSHLRIDTPARSPEYQTIGIHFNFTGTYETARTFLHLLPTLKYPIAVQSYSLSKTSKTSTLTITVDGTLPWRQAL